MGKCTCTSRLRLKQVKNLHPKFSLKDSLKKSMSFSAEGYNLIQPLKNCANIHIPLSKVTHGFSQFLLIIHSKSKILTNVSFRLNTNICQIQHFQHVFLSVFFWQFKIENIDQFVVPVSDLS